MSKNQHQFPLLLTKKDIYNFLEYKSMDTIYRKILTEKKLKDLGFNSLSEFKRIKQFDLEQSIVIKDFLIKVKNS